MTIFLCNYKRMLMVFFATLCLPLVGCGTMQAVDEHVSVGVSSQLTLYRDQWVRRGSPAVYVHPKEQAAAAPTALFVPFRVTQPITDPDLVGYSQARIVWQTWLSMQLFPAMEFAGEHGVFRRDTALALARSKGADLLIGGFVTYYYPGGSTTNSQLSIQVEIYDTSTGQLVWSMAHAGAMPSEVTNDYLLFATKTRLPSDPMYVITKVLAEDMGALLRKWVSGPGAEDPPLKRLDKAVERQIRGTPPTPMIDHSAPQSGRPTF